MSDTKTAPPLAAGAAGRRFIVSRVRNGVEAALSSVRRTMARNAPLVPYGLAALAPMMILGGPGIASATIVISTHTLLMSGLVVFVLWLLYKVLTSAIYAVVALVVLGAILLQLHVIPSTDVPFKLAPL